MNESESVIRVPMERVVGDQAEAVEDSLTGQLAATFTLDTRFNLVLLIASIFAALALGVLIVAIELATSRSAPIIMIEGTKEEPPLPLRRRPVSTACIIRRLAPPGRETRGRNRSRNHSGWQPTRSGP